MLEGIGVEKGDGYKNPNKEAFKKMPTKCYWSCHFKEATGPASFGYFRTEINCLQRAQNGTYLPVMKKSVAARTYILDRLTPKGNYLSRDISR